MGGIRNVCKVLVRKYGRKRQLGRPRCRWEDNITILAKLDGKLWTIFVWLRVGTSGSLL
jgi:hypothetical protein